jgi:hypothetical protein
MTSVNVTIVPGDTGATSFGLRTSKGIVMAAITPGIASCETTMLV